MAKKKTASKADILIVKSKVREYVKSLGEFQMSSDFIEALNTEVAGLIQSAAERTKANNRKTLSARDV
ncbi:MAG: DUF1931 domain-containing protein [Candidatus Heimdallarchaeaceae archaeon]|uniref:DUF1931 domain-containing protein n=1 Tax=Candidatus Heimdallarchaeum endolithica TaxID=2876572 RepID=A0A9Y1FPJ9_9ARCH|nr:MAG: hypothetical protein K9W46_00960 [Candidatus Heimdallarchaeum endolithica]